MNELLQGVCSDCGRPSRPMSALTLRKGSSVRESGEALCGSCSSHRAKMVRELDTIPDRIDQIRARRMVRGAA